MDMTTCTRYSPQEIEEEAVLSRQQETLVADPFVDRLLDAFPEPTMVLNSRRQIVRANKRTEELLRASRDRMLGLRFGDAIRCTRALDAREGCGATKACQYCGAARAMMNCMTAHVADIRECRVESRLNEESAALDLRVSASPFCCQGQEFTVITIRDITDEKRRQVLERTFFHDILNSAGSLKGLLDIVGHLRGEDEETVRRAIRNLSRQIVEEIQSQRDLVSAQAGQLQVTLLNVNVHDLIEDICMIYRQHSVGCDKRILLKPIQGQPVIRTDKVLLGRVLGNLIKNALEASDRGQTVTVAFEQRRHPLFSIHNSSVMSEAVQQQMFQRSFSPKEGKGRGIGSYSIKLLTEKYLGGDVSFVSRELDGTTFLVALPSPSVAVLSPTSLISRQGSMEFEPGRGIDCTTPPSIASIPGAKQLFSTRLNLQAGVSGWF
jgi:nitrogen fixation/metabolism regulation signal transduction histidine kinase